MPPPHQHNWSANPSPGCNVLVGVHRPVAGTIIVLNFGSGGDTDTCLTMFPPCTFAGNQAHPAMIIVTWGDGGAGGQFGKLVGGAFQTCPPNEVTHYKCADPPAGAGLTITMDDLLQVVDPVTHQVIYTADDAPVTSPPAQITVWDITSPTKDPLQKFVLPDSVPAAVDVDVAASVLAYWGFMPGPQLIGTWNNPVFPTDTNVLHVTTQNNRPGQPWNGYLPDANTSFGGKGVQATEDTFERTTTRQFLLFYPKDGTKHPISGDHGPDWGTGGPSPNWYFYWSQTSADYGDHVYDSRYARSHTEWNGNRWATYVGPGSGTGPAGTPPFAWGAAEGIDLFACACRHEAQHVADMIADWQGPWDRQQDGDEDHLRNAVERDKRQYHPEGYDPTQAATYLDHFNYGADWDDCEDHAMHGQLQWSNGAANGEDWSAGVKSKQWP